MENVPKNVSNLKSKAGNLDVDKLVSVPNELRKQSDIVKNDDVKKDAHMLR